MNSLAIDQIRLEASSKLDPSKRSALGQFMTPSKIAEFMASLFSNKEKPIHLMDAGAGVGSLTLAAAATLKNIASIETWEIDSILQKYLKNNLQLLKLPFIAHHADFIQDSILNIKKPDAKKYTHAILNPPYKKINSNSLYRLLLREVEIETVNLYSAFIALAILRMESKGQIVAIIPRSFCNGPYYKPFRAFLLNHCSIEHIHIFESRNKAFKDDAVLQENIILKLVKNKKQGAVEISSSHDDKFQDYVKKNVPFSDIIKSNDTEFFIHIPTCNSSKINHAFSYTLKDLDLEVSTGPIVDFRVKDYWLKNPTEDSIPLIYPHHFINNKFEYPREHKKPNALKWADEIKRQLMPKGYYVLVKRFSTKEEKRRVVAYLLDPNDISVPFVGLENHWNVFHIKKHGLSKDVAKGLACILNSTYIDEHFRIFSGHTQVNATDLRNMRYPNLLKIIQLGSKYRFDMSQEEVDHLVKVII